eukprot:6069174-Prymnesium_polylepis.2
MRRQKRSERSKNGVGPSKSARRSRARSFEWRPRTGVAQRTHQHLDLLLVGLAALHAAGDAQHALDRAQAPVVVSLLGKQLLGEQEERDELVREDLGLDEALRRQLDLDDVLK